MHCKKLFATWLAIAIVGAMTVASLPALGQSTITGDITGIVTDPSGAAVPNATVTLKNTETGATQTRTTSAQGAYRFPLLNPGTYAVSAQAQGFSTQQQNVAVTVGQASTVNMQLALASASQTVEVTAEGGTVQTENGNISTTFTAQQIANVPNPGNDLSYIVQTAPGAVMNTQAGYGNSAVYGTPATSNLFTINGMNENDPFLNLNNSGATNLLLGQNDVQQATVVSNGYSGQYGGLAGAQVNYVTKSGTNNWHGNMQYFWNGRIMNANNYFNNQGGTPRPFDNANQWGASIGGPIVKDKTFFFVNTEGLRVVLPTNTLVRVPTPQFAAATLANIAAVSPTQLPFYQNMFNLYAGAPGASRAVPSADAAGSCGGTFTGPGGLGTTAPCSQSFRSTASNQTNEWLLTGRVDQNIGNNDRLFAHFRTDHGLQATFTDPINPAFNAQSVQPQYEGQLNETHTFAANAVNQFILSGSWYSAIFQPTNLGAATALMPFRLGFSGSTFNNLGRFLNDWPQGRNVSQYGFVDDLSVQKGSHALKFGASFRRYDITDYDNGIGTIGYSSSEDLTDFFNGLSTFYQQSFAQKLRQPVALYQLGLYAQDEWAVRPNLRLNLALRADHNSNPVCQTNCFARLNTSFFNLNHDPTQPYNQAIRTGLHQALDQYSSITWQPRLGFAWTPFGTARNTVLRGGIGLFADAFPATVADLFMANPPLVNTFTTSGQLLAPGAGSVSSAVSAANAAFVSGFQGGGTLASIQAATPLFSPPSIVTPSRRIFNPTYEEWNLEFQQGFGRKTSFSINYVGNHGYHEAIQNAGVNAFCNAAPIALYPATAPANVAPCATAIGTGTSFTGLPATPPDPRFGTVTEIQSAGVSNYNGVTLSMTRRFSSLQVQANYTYSHALDEISNAGFLPYNADTNVSMVNPQDPYNLRRYNYGNADYDVRHYASMNYVWDTPRIQGALGVLADWTVSGTVYYRTGLPFTVVDSVATGTLNGYNYGTTNGAGPEVFANYLGGASPGCTRAAVLPASGTGTPCLTTTSFTPALTSFGNQRRNQFFGPRFFDTDLTVLKNFHFPHWESAKLGIGLQFFNLLNHVNFDQPVADVQDPSFGQIINTVTTPTSIVGSFLGGDASPRMIQVKGQLTF